MSWTKHAAPTQSPTAPAAVNGDISGELSHLEERDDLPAKKPARERDPFSARRDAWTVRGREHPDLADFPFRLLDRLGDHAGIRSDGFVFHSRMTLAAEFNKSVDTIDRAIENAESCDLLRVQRLGDKRSTNRYWPCLDGAPLGPFKGKTLVGRFPAELETPTRSEAAKMRPPIPPKGVAAKLRSSSRKNAATWPQKCGPIYLSDLPKDPPKSDADATFKAFRETAKRCGCKLSPSVKKNWAADLAELEGLGLELDAHVLPVLEYWEGQIDRLSNLRGDAEEIRRRKWLYNPANEFRIPAEVAWSDHVEDLVELFQRAGWRPCDHSELFAGSARIIEEDFYCFGELDEVVELMLQESSTPTAPQTVDTLIDHFQASQPVKHPGWSFEIFAEALAQFPHMAFGPNFRRRWEHGCARMADAGLAFEHDVLPSIVYRESWGRGSPGTRTLDHPCEVEHFADSLRDLRWLRNSQDPFRIPDDLPITKYTRRGYELFCLAGWRPTEHPDVFATFNNCFRRGLFYDCWHTIEFVIATGTLREEPVPLEAILAAHERDREKILAWRAEGEFDDDAYHDTELPIDPRVEARL